MTDTTQAAMHHDHREWASEISLWRDNLRAWQQELAAAQSQLQELQQGLDHHSQALRQHASALRLDEDVFGGHEHALANFAQGREGNDLLLMAQQHGQVAQRQAELRTAHEQLKRRHHSLISRWNELVKVLRQPAGASDEPPPARTDEASKHVIVA